jgi:hypothetical protein
VNNAATKTTSCVALQEDGKFRDSKSRDAKASTQNAGFAYSIFAVAWPHIQGSPSTTSVTTAAQTISELLNDAVGSEASTLELAVGETDALYANAVVFEGLAALLKASEDKIETFPDPSQNAAFVRHFLASRGSRDVFTSASVRLCGSGPCCPCRGCDVRCLAIGRRSLVWRPS